MTDPTSAASKMANGPITPQNLFLGVAIYTAIMAVLWLTGTAHIGFFWVIAPAAYSVHMMIQAGMIHKAVEIEIEKAFNNMEDLLPQDVVVTQFHDATPYEGSLN